MTQLIASNQLTLTNVNDGQPSYTHIAYADKSTDVFFDAMSTFGAPLAYRGSVLTSTKIPGGYKITSTGGTNQIKQFVQFNGTTGKNCYTYVVIKNTHLINDLVVAFNGIGSTLNTNFSNVVVKPGQTYVDYRPAVCRDTYDFSQIVILATAIENDLAYEIYDYALFNTNPIINFSVGGNANNTHIGMYVDNVELGSTDPTKYRWTLIKGADGAQGIPGPKGEDGQTPYVHFAYSDNADGTGLTATDNGQRYIGQYSDYTQADSTDKTKYRWADRWAKIEVGGKNIIRNSAFANAVDSPSSFTVGGVTYFAKRIPNWFDLYNSGIPNPTTSYHAIYKELFNGKSPVIEFNESDGSRNWKALSAILQTSDLNFGNYTFSADIYATGTGTKIWFGFYYFNKNGVQNFHSGQTTVNITTINSWHRASGAIKLNNDIDLTKPVIFYIYAYNFTSNSILYLTKPQLEKGTVATPYGESQSDINNRIDAKADQALTQEQINALNEKNQILETEMQAKASMEAFSEFEKAYRSFVESNAEGQAKAEADLIEAGRRIELLTIQFGGLAELKTFIDTYMSSSNEGLIIGKNDASSTIKVSSDRISMFSAGKEVMYISQGVINIDNGIFTVSVQIGKFRTEQYELNADMNVIRFVG